MKRDTLKGITVSLVAIVLSFGLCELVIRIMGTAPEIFRVQDGRFRLSENPLIGYELVPHFESETAGDMVDFTDRSNSLGFRDREHDVKNPAGTYRILVLGDSITQGWKVTDRLNIFTSVIENRLTAEGENVEVLNFGVNGYNSRQEVETLREKGLAFDPDLVIVAYCVNDMFVDSGSIQRDLERRKEQQPALRIPGVFLKSAFIRQIWALIITYTKEPLPHKVYPDELSDSLVPDAFADLGTMAGQHGFDVLVAGFPFLTDIARGPDPNLFADVEELSRHHGFFFFDLSSTLSSAARIRNIETDALHPNTQGHKFVGEALADVIRTEFLASSR